MSITASLRGRGKRALIWVIDHAGPAGSRQARREVAVTARVRFVRALRRIHPLHRRMRLARLRAIAELKSAAVPDMVAADSAPQPRAIAPNLSGARIGVFVPGFLSGFGGAEKVAGQVAKLLNRAGARVDVICILPSHAVRPYTLDSGIELQVLPAFGEERRLRARNYDLLIAFGMPGFYRRIPAVAEALDVPFVIQECTNPTAMTQALATSLSLETEAEADWVRQAVLAHAACARFTTPAYAGTVHADIGPFAYGFYNAFSRPLADAPEKPAQKFICVGALKNRNKNGLAAAESFAAFGTRHLGWSLYFYGENNFASALAELGRGRNPPAIVDAGVERDITRIYGDAWALIIPSFAEGLPNVVVEAFTYGVPCIGFNDCDGVRHLIEDGRTGLLVDRRKPGALTEAMERLASAALRDELSANALAFAQSQLGLATWEAHWLDLTARALAGTDKAGRNLRPVAYRGDNQHSAAWRRLLATYPVTG